MNALFVPIAPLDYCVPALAGCEGMDQRGTKSPSPAADAESLKFSPLGLEVLRALNEAFDEAAEMTETASTTITEFCRGE